MTEAERRELGQTRRLVFQNLANGVLLEQVMVDFKLSALEVDQIRRHVARKITGYLVLRRQPLIACDSVRELRLNRRGLLGVLARIGNLDLSSDLILITDKTGATVGSLGRILTQSLDHPEMLEGATHKMAEANRKL